MPWSRNHLPKYRKHRRSGQAVVTLNARDFYLGPYGTKVSRDNYDRIIQEWLANNRQPLGVSEDEITVVELSARFLLHAKSHYQKYGRCTGVVSGVRCALKYLCDRYGNEPAFQFGPLALKVILDKMVEEGLSRRYINDHLARINPRMSIGCSMVHQYNWSTPTRPTT